MATGDNAVPMDYPLPTRNRVPSGKVNEYGKPMYYDREWTDFELAEAREAHRKVMAAES